MMINSEFVGLDKYRQVLQRFAWRIQYHARKQINHEIVALDIHNSHDFQNDITDWLNYIQIHELIQSIDSEKGRYIIRRIYIDGLKEKEVADELHISQQAVSKWKKKSLEFMRREIKSFTSETGGRL